MSATPAIFIRFKMHGSNRKGFAPICWTSEKKIRLLKQNEHFIRSIFAEK